MPDYPFLRPAFIDALESSGSVSRETGWQPAHVQLDTESCSAFMPLYLKNHSWGEYVFDWSWADAYQRNNLPYYPKLVSAIPFTPATGPRVRCDKGQLSRETCSALVRRVRQLAAEHGASGWHLLFPQRDELDLFRQPGLLHREGVQYHWRNRGYNTFDDFLDCLASRKRKMIKRERRKVKEQNLSTQLFPGGEIASELWDFFYEAYTRTYWKRSGNPGYLNRQFFREIAGSMAEQVALAVAFEAGQPVAGALYFYDQTTLYGRYWGCLKEFEHLHFELCYYQGIEFAIARRLQTFDAGAQGEHKIIRGFEPVITHSLHWIAHPEFASAIGDFLARERGHNILHLRQARERLPFRQGA